MTLALRKLFLVCDFPRAAELTVTRLAMIAGFDIVACEYTDCHLSPALVRQRCSS